MHRLTAIFEPERNCWRVAKASHAAIIVDYANYYRDLHQSICKARKSVFILGWDIDGRIELIRGEDKEKSSAPAKLFDLIQWKLEQNPDIKIYLNKWDYSIFFAKEREPFAGLHWHTIKSENFHYCIDGILPLGACHHQKIAVIDDEIAYCGGMDIALARWDHREHHIHNKDRKDPSDLFHPDEKVAFTPYHDLMMLTAGDAAQSLAELVRDRWRLACDTPTPPLEKNVSADIPDTWPDSDPPDFENVDIAIARTLPPVKRRKRREEIIEAYLDEIPQAEKFIYIENQFLVQQDIARAINRQLRAKPDLRVLAVSCDRPKGVMERKSMWATRLKFREILESGGVENRVALVHPISRENGQQDPVRIHSKLMIIDDKYLHLGSANINNRSMGMDTECDQIIIGQDEKSRLKIAAVRTDLIREHSGRAAEDIDRLVAENAPISAFLENVPTSRQHFKRIDDEEFRHERFVKLAKALSDPRRPLITANLTIPISHRHFEKHLSKPWVWIVSLVLILAGLAYLLQASDMSDLLSVAGLGHAFEKFSHSPFAVPVILCLFIASSLILFPITIMIAATSAAFGPVYGFIISICGTLLSASVGYAIGRRIGSEKFPSAFRRFEKLKSRIRHGGVGGVCLIRMLPIAPFGVMNILFGVNAVSFSSYVIGTILGILPGTIAMAFFGSSLFEVLKNPDGTHLFYTALGLAAWIGVIVFSHGLEKKIGRTR